MFLKALPKTVKRLAVMDRTKEPGSVGEPMYVDVRTALIEAGRLDVQVYGGRYGAVQQGIHPHHDQDHLRQPGAGRAQNHFTVGIVDDVTHTSLPQGEQFNAAPEGTIACKFYGLGSDGTVGANKNSIKIIDDHTDLKVQALRL